MLHHCDLCHIDLERISVRRGGQVLLQDVSMHIHCGQLTVLIGQNGAGKTTLIRALLGQIPHTGVIRHVDSRGLDSSALERSSNPVTMVSAGMAQPPSLSPWIRPRAMSSLAQMKASGRGRPSRVQRLPRS